MQRGPKGRTQGEGLVKVRTLKGIWKEYTEGVCGEKDAELGLEGRTLMG